jgi:hypothetical protein
MRGPGGGIPFGMTAVPDPNAGLTRLLICAPMKSGSTYTGAVLARYFGVPEIGPLGINVIHFLADHNLTENMALELRGRGFSFNFHMVPHLLNILIAQHEKIQLLAVWRNLGDMFVSIDEHAFRETENGPAFYTTALEEYRAFPQEQRHLVRVDFMLPWYVRFYLMWRAADMVLHPYEQMLIEKEAYFGRIIESVAGPVDRGKLAESVGVAGENSRLNVGIAGRGATHLSDPVKREIEARLMRHPDWAQLEVLLWELPWAVPALAKQHEFDGQVVATSGASHVHFVSRGRRFPIGRPSWLLSRAGARRVPTIVEAAELERLPVGATLF